MSKITVKSKSPNGFRRAGIQFNREGVDLDTQNLTEKQLEAIVTEPNLVISETIDDGSAAQAAAAAAAKAEKAATAAAAKAEKVAAAAEAERLAAAAKADKDAKGREKKANSTEEGKAAWEAAAAIAIADLSPEEFQALPAADRVARIEAVIAGVAK